MLIVRLCRYPFPPIIRCENAYTSGCFVTEIGFYIAENTRALQSDIVTGLVGPLEEAFRMPQDLLIQYSKPLGKMCSSGFVESCSRFIRLPEVAGPSSWNGPV